MKPVEKSSFEILSMQRAAQCIAKPDGEASDGIHRFVVHTTEMWIYQVRAQAPAAEGVYSIEVTDAKGNRLLLTDPMSWPVPEDFDWTVEITAAAWDVFGLRLWLEPFSEKRLAEPLDAAER